MATFSRENIGTLHDKITVTLSKDDYMPGFDKQLKRFSKTANIPGFRKGMVPAGMVRKMHGQSILNEEIVRSAGSKLDKYIKDEKLLIFAQPMIMPDANRIVPDLSMTTDVDFTFEIGVKPEFEITPLKDGTTLTKYKIAVNDKMLDDEIDRIKQRFGKVDEQTIVTAKEDIIYAIYEPCDIIGQVTEADKKVEDTVALENMPAKLKDMVMGRKPADIIIFRPVDVCNNEELSPFMNTLKGDSIHQNYKLTITKVGHLIPANMGQELYAQVFQNAEVKDEADFREKISEELSRELNRIAGERLQNEMFEVLVHKTPITLPVPFLKRWMREGGEKPKSAQEVENEFPSFEHQLRWQLISDKLFAENGISVSREEVNNDIKARVLAYFGLGIDDEDEAPWMDGYMAKISKDEKMVDETFRRILFGKLFTFLETQFNIEEKEIGEEEFFKLGDAHAAHHHHH